MVEDQLRPRGIKDERVLSAMESVGRHLFVRKDLEDADDKLKAARKARAAYARTFRGRTTTKKDRDYLNIYGIQALQYLRCPGRLRIQ